MDIFDVFSGNLQQKKSDNAAKLRGAPLVQRCGIVVSLHQESILFFDDKSVKEVFVPRTQVQDWWFTSDGSKRNLSLSDLELDDEVTLVIPKWLANKEGLQ